MPANYPAVKNTTIQFKYVFFNNGIPTTPLEFTSVDIYKETNSSPILVQSTSTGDIVETSTGVFTYSTSLITESGNYFERINIIPEAGQEFTQEIPFTVYDSNPAYTGKAQNKKYNTCRIYGSIVEPNGNAFSKIPVTATIITYPNQINNTQDSVATNPIVTFTDDAGNFYLDLIQNVTYYVSINDILFKQVIIVPEQESALLWSISPTKEIGDQTNDVTSGQNTW